MVSDKIFCYGISDAAAAHIMSATITATVTTTVTMTEAPPAIQHQTSQLPPLNELLVALDARQQAAVARQEAAAI